MRERDTLSAANQDLIHEILKYKSVELPDNIKPRTNLTRVTRPVFTNYSTNAMPAMSTTPCGALEASTKGTILEHIPGDMTLQDLT